ncbi:hypothetical protein [Streptomyces carpinensis]|nr:hypothetical protein [Streptomyces carpinensis]
MSQTPETPQPRQPGVRYKKETRERPVTTVIDGRASTRMVTEEVWVALPPRDWDEIIRRGAITVAVIVTLLAAAGTTASVGGLMSRMLHPVVSYAVGVVYTASWLVCVGIEQIERVDADRAARARNAGWVMLLGGMAAVITYGQVLDQLAAGIVGSFLDAAAKGLWWLIMGLDRVKLNPDVAHWVADREQEMAGRHLLGVRLARLNRRAVQMRAAGPEFRAAEAIIAGAAQPRQVTASDTSGQTADAVSGQPVQTPPEPPTPPVPPPSGQGPGVSAPVSGQQSAPTPPPAAPVPPAQPAGGAHPIGESIAATVRQLLDDHPEWAVDQPLDEAEMTAITDAVRTVHGDRPDLRDTVRRTRDRELKKRRKSA